MATFSFVISRVLARSDRACVRGDPFLAAHGLDGKESPQQLFFQETRAERDSCPHCRARHRGLQFQWLGVFRGHCFLPLLTLTLLPRSVSAAILIVAAYSSRATLPIFPFFLRDQCGLFANEFLRKEKTSLTPGKRIGLGRHKDVCMSSSSACTSLSIIFPVGRRVGHL